MQVKVTARHFKLTEELKKYAENEALKLTKYYDDIIDSEIILWWENKDRIAEINLSVYNKIITVHERSDNMVKSVDMCIDKLKRKLKKYKDRRRDFEHESVDEHLENEVNK
ncbi:MAG: ribosome-associated translation inhibitor RaiA [bacterium]|jgi:putative sigma-54 modulation protein